MGFPRDGTGINFYEMGIGQINISLGQPCKFPPRFLRATDVSQKVI